MVTYIEYSYSTAKGEVVPGTADAIINSPFGLGKVDANYTSDRVVEPVETFTSGTTTVAWAPVVAGSIKLLDINGQPVKLTEGATVTADAEGKITVTGNTEPLTAVKKIAYVYNNIVVPQNDIPSIKAEMKSIPLLAKARRIAVYYSQIAA